MKSILKISLVVILATEQFAQADSNTSNSSNTLPVPATQVVPDLQQDSSENVGFAPQDLLSEATSPSSTSSSDPAPTPTPAPDPAPAPVVTPSPQEDISKPVAETTASLPNAENQASPLIKTLTLLLSKLGHKITQNEDGSLSIQAPAHQIVLTARLREDRQELELVGQRKDQIAGRILSLRGLNESNVNKKAAEVVTLARGICRELTPGGYAIFEKDTQRQIKIAVLLLTTVSAYSMLHARTTLFQRIAIIGSIWLLPNLWRLIKEEVSYQWNN